MLEKIIRKFLDVHPQIRQARKMPTRNFLILFSALIFLGNSSWAKDRDVAVSGTCTRKATTDQASLTLTADFQDTDLNEAIRKATHAYTRASEAIQRIGLPDAELKTTEYSVNEVREWDKDKSVFKGFRARMGLRVATSDVAKMGQVISIAAREDIHDVSELTTSLSVKKLRSEQGLCLKEAALNARDKAEKLASALNTRVAEVLTITETSSDSLPPRPIRPMMREQLAAPMSAEVAPPAVQSGTQEVTVTIQAVFALK